MAVTERRVRRFMMTSWVKFWRAGRRASVLVCSVPRSGPRG
jgi:hypothetical protein